MARYDLSDFEWSVVEPPLPNKPRRVPLAGPLLSLRTRAPT